MAIFSTVSAWFAGSKLASKTGSLLMDARTWVVIGLIAVCVWVWWGFDSRDDQINQLRQTNVQLENRLSSLKAENKNLEDSFVELTNTVAKVEQINDKITRQIESNERSLSNLRNEFSTIDLERLYEKSPKQAGDRMTEIFQRQVECLQANANGVPNENCK